MKNTYVQVLSSIALFLIILSAGSCKKSSPAAIVVIPSVNTTNALINVTTTSAVSGGVITNDGGSGVSSNGVCYSINNKTPTLLDSKTSDPVLNSGIANSTFTSNLTGLTPNTMYYVRAYATNSAGTGYGAVITFTTSGNLLSVNSTVSTFVGNGTPGYADGSGLGAQFNNPQGITMDSKGNLFVSDTYNNYIREVTPGGTTSTIAGDGTIGFQNGTGTSAEFYGPWGLTFDKSSNLLVADFGNNVIRKITTGGVVSTYVGTGQAGYNNGTDPLFYYFNNPTGVAMDSKGNLYIADFGNNVIRKVTPAGIASTFAGTRTAGFVNGDTSSSSFNKPSALVIDTAGNIYIADQGNFAIRKITSAGVVTTLVGGPSQPGVVGTPTGLALDAAGNLYISDENGRILQYTTGKVVYVLAGTSGQFGFVNGSGAVATFNQPQGITIDNNNNIYVADKYNNCIRKVAVVDVKTSSQ